MLDCLGNIKRNFKAIHGNRQLRLKILIGFLYFITISITFYPLCNIHADEGSFKRFIDPKARYELQYPATMEIEFNGPDQVRIFHPRAPFRIHVFIEKRRQPGKPDSTALLTSLAGRLEKEMGKIEILDAKSPIKGDKRHGYAVFRFKNSRGVDLTQLVRYFVAKDRVLQLIISDKSKGYANIKPIFDKTCNSLKIFKESLK